MFDYLLSSASESGAVPDFDHAIGALITEGKYDKAERWLRALIDDAPEGRLRSLLLSSSAATIELSGWSDLHDWLADGDVPAIGVALSPTAIEAADISNPTVPLSICSGSQAFAAESAERRITPTNADGFWRDAQPIADLALTMKGFSATGELRQAMQTDPEALVPEDRAAFALLSRLGQWWLQVALHKAFALDLPTRMMPRPAPFLLRTQLGSTAADSVHYPALVDAPADDMIRQDSDTGPLALKMPRDMTDPAFYRALDAEMARLMQAHRFTEAGAFLVACLHTRRHPLAEMCVGLEGEEVSFVGWAEVQRDALTRDPETGRYPAAIALIHADAELSDGKMVADYADGRKFRLPEGWADAAVRRQRLNDERFAYQTATFTEIDAHCCTGMPEEEVIEEQWSRAVRGLEELHGALMRARGERVAEDDDAYGSVTLAWWYLAVRWHDAVALCARTQGLARRIPVIVGIDGMPRAFTVTHLPSRAAPPEASDIPPLGQTRGEWQREQRERQDREKKENAKRKAEQRAKQARESPARAKAEERWENRDTPRGQTAEEHSRLREERFRDFTRAGYEDEQARNAAHKAEKERKRAERDAARARPDFDLEAIMSSLHRATDEMHAEAERRGLHKEGHFGQTYSDTDTLDLAAIALKILKKVR